MTFKYYHAMDDRFKSKQRENLVMTCIKHKEYLRHCGDFQRLTVLTYNPESTKDKLCRLYH